LIKSREKKEGKGEAKERRRREKERTKENERQKVKHSSNLIYCSGLIHTLKCNRIKIQV
jgi:hypothetical protein